MTKKKEEPIGPTPTVGFPRANGQIFTYSENKLLDQITLEVMEAWKKDLTIIRNHHKEILESERSARRLSDTICYEFPKLEEFLNRNEFIEDFHTIMEKIEYIFIQQGIINKSLFNVEEKLKYENLKVLTQKLDDFDKLIVSIQKKIDENVKNKWWKKFFKPKI